MIGFWVIDAAPWIGYPFLEEDVLMTKYSPLRDFLEKQPKDEVRLNFDDVEKILGVSLPRSAYEHQAWWANDPGHSQCRSWQDAGWKTENLNLSRRTVVFTRISGRSPAVTPPMAPFSLDPWGALAGTVTIHDEEALTSPSGEIWDAEHDA
jgi:hypothetical protein